MNSRLRKIAISTGVGAALFAALGCAMAFAQPADAAQAPDLAQRVADLEAYINNVAPKGTPVAGPGHNGWLMTSSALVLFMTLPGLFLFYGGLVRRKNILSVAAQCFGCARTSSRCSR
jgi:Amt family ammonium transporter